MIETGSINVVEPASYLNGTYGGSRIAKLSAELMKAGLAVPAFPIYITRALCVVQSGGLPIGATGLLSLDLDRNGLFSKGCNPPYPVSQTGPFGSLVSLCSIQLNGPQFSLIGPTNFFTAPVSYDETNGDVILVDIPGVSIGNDVPIQFCWALGWTNSAS